MKVVVSKRALVQAIVESISENEEPEFERIDVIGDSPIDPVEMMSTQLAEAMPPVDDPDFIPATLEELSRSAYVISKEVPASQIEYFYRKLHELLDDCIDREAARDIKIESLRKVISLIAEGNHDDFGGYEFDPDDDSFDELSAEELIAKYHKQAGTSPPAQSEPVDSNKDSAPEDEEVENDTDDESDLPAERSIDSYIHSDLDDVIQAIIDKGMHVVELRDESGNVQTAPTLKMDDQGEMTLSDEPMRIVASESTAGDIAARALEDQDVKSMFDKLVKTLNKKYSDDKMAKKIGYFLLIGELSKYLGKEGDPVDPETAAIMAANNMADTLAKSMGIPKFGPEISDVMVTTASDLKSSGEETVQASSGTGRDVITRTVPKQTMVDALNTVAEERKEKPRRGRKQTYEIESVPTPEELAGIESARELAEIEKNMKSLTANAAAFGYSGAAGLRQWMNKFPLMSWTILMGEEKGAEAFQGYRSLLVDYMLTLSDNLIDKVIPAIISGVKKSDSVSDEDQEDIIGLLEDLSADFEEMRQSTVTSDDEEIDPDLLLGDFSEGDIGGAVLRNALNSLFRKDDLAQVSNYIEKEMIPFLMEDQGLSKKAATKLAHMFNGRVKMTLPTDLKKAAAGENVPKSVSNVYNLGIGYDQMAAAQKKVATILGTWFNEDIGKKRRKAAAAKDEVSKFSRDKLRKSVDAKLTTIADSDEEIKRIKYLADLLDDAIGATAKDVELEIELEKQSMPKSEREKL